MTGLVGSIALGGIVGKAKSVLGSIPWQIWAVIAGVALLGVGSCVHGHKVKAFGKAQFSAGRAAADADWEKALDKAHADALAWKAKAEANAAAISKEIGERHEATLRADTARANDLRLRGPGKASCSGPVHNPGISASPSGHQQAGGRTDAPSSEVPPGDWAAVPWHYLVDQAQLCDANRSEAISWRDWYAKQAAAVHATP